MPKNFEISEANLFSNYIWNLTSKEITQSPNPESYSGSYPGQILMQGVQANWFRDLIIMFHKIGQNSLNPTFKQRINFLITEDLFKYDKSSLRLSKVEKSFLFNEKYLEQMNWTVPQPQLLVEQFSKTEARLYVNRWVFTLILTEKSTEEIIELGPAPYTMTVNGRFVTSFREKNVLTGEAIYNHIASYSNEKLCPCLSSLKKPYETCCKPLFFRSITNSLGIYPLYYNKEIRSLYDNEKILVEDKWENDKEYLRLSETIKRKVKNRNKLHNIFTLLYNFSVPAIDENGPEIDKVVKAVATQIEKIAAPHSAWIVEDSNGMIINVAATKKAQKAQLRDTYLNILYGHFYEKIGREIEYLIARYPDFEYNFNAYVDDLSISNEEVKQRIKKSFELFLKGETEAACYILTAQIEPLIRIGVKNDKGEYAILEKPNKGSVQKYLTLGTLISNMPSNRVVLSKTEKQEDITIAKKHKYLQSLYFRTLCGWGMNIRNNLFHGFETREYSSQEYFAVLYLTLRVTQMLDVT